MTAHEAIHIYKTRLLVEHGQIKTTYCNLDDSLEPISYQNTATGKHYRSEALPHLMNEDICF